MHRQWQPNAGARREVDEGREATHCGGANRTPWVLVTDGGTFITQAIPQGAAGQPPKACHGVIASGALALSTSWSVHQTCSENTSPLSNASRDVFGPPLLSSPLTITCGNSRVYS